MNSGSKVLLGALAGAATGAFIAALFGTEQGAEARSRIAEGTQTLRNDLSGRLGDLKSTASDKLQTVKQGASDLIEAGRSKLSGVTNSASTADGSAI